MKNLIACVVLLSGFVFIYRLLKGSALIRRQKFIQGFIFPQTIKKKIYEAYPHLTESEVNEVVRGLKEYFHLCNLAGKEFVSMPSQVVDLAWHEFILFTSLYRTFCNKAFGRFLHHVPAEAMRTPTIAQKGIKKAWRLSCRREKINPEIPIKLPILFAIDAKLKIANGFYYTLNCKGTDATGFCASDIGGSCGGSGCGTHSDSGCSSGCGGGD
ncbi:MAG TPA: hypothetical protein VN030_07480 [Cellvibrio sp.]|nr:hypothetical protein [Cellvibrio sp.]